MNLAHIAVRITAGLAHGHLVYVADDEHQAEMLAAQVRALAPHHPVIFVPSSDALPGDAAPPSPANSGKRVAALRMLRSAQLNVPQQNVALFLSGEAAARRYPPPESFDLAPPTLHAGDTIDMGAFGERLLALGYIEDDRVDEPGEIALRGDVIDIFPADAGAPARVELAEGVISAIRTYDPVTQRTTGSIKSLEIGRAAEPETGDAISILDHLSPGAIFFGPKADERRKRFIRLAADSAGRSNSALDAVDDAQWQTTLKAWSLLAIQGDFTPLPRFAEARSPLADLARHVKPLLDDGRLMVLAGHSRDLRFLRSRVGKRLGRRFPDADAAEIGRTLGSGTTGTRRGASGIDAATEAIALEMPCEAGFIDDNLVWIAAADILGSRALLSDNPAPLPPWAAVAADIRCGDIVIHEDHGVARVVGLESAPDIAGSDHRKDPPERAEELGTDEARAEMIALEFAKGARRLVQIDAANRLWRYGADADAVTLDTLNGSSWEKRRASISVAIAESAQGLAHLAAEREKLEAVIIAPDAAAYERFAGSFPFNETPDQSRAIKAVREDLASGKPMDRLVVGDVGYGKTEVALRAAALAALAGQQVIVAAPTTVLVRQHLESFTRRFEGTGITVASLSRLSSAAERKAVKAGLADGSIRIVIGTGAVAAKNLVYKNLALVIIDEEQRFGAADKARLRGTGERHLLTLSATPIPRTLQMALVGLQQISLIATPPARRQPIRTSLDTFDDGRIRTALLREKSRGGQSFVVVPRIEDMAKLEATLRRIVPNLQLVLAHGKMPATDIDEAMVAFGDGRGDVLLATNIIEAGLDVPRANTMIIWRADRFGLAQLHQLRGRVGRGNRRGQVILLTDEKKGIAERTLKRLRTLAAFDRLGAGFDISAQDLDIRGSGDLLGETQSGHIKLIGADLYQHLLGDAMREARGQTVARWTPELNLGEVGALPDSWIPEADIRLSLYVRLARLESDSEIDAFEDELADRFGALPPPAQLLLDTARIRVAARTIGIARIDAGPAAIALTPRDGFAGDIRASGLVEKNGRIILRKETDEADRIAQVHALLDTVAP